VAPRAVLEEQARRALQSARVIVALGDKQRDFVLDPAKRLAAHAGRRSGKSHGHAARYMLTAIGNPGLVSVFIAISAARANDIIGRAFEVLGKSTGIVARPTKRSGQLYYEFANGHAVWAAGCKNRADAEKFRGSPFCDIAVDEADSMRGHLEYLVEDVLEPCLLDYSGRLALTGTPGVTPAGYFHAVTTGEDGRTKWPTHNWTVLDNPYVAHAKAWLEAKCRELGLDPTSPSYMREWLGLWILDVESLCYPYAAVINAEWAPLDTATISDWRYVLGVDLGINDATAFVVLAYRPGLPNLHIVEAHAVEGLSPSGAAARVLAYRQQYLGIRVVADTGGQGKAFVTEWIQRFGIPAEPAMKLDVGGQIALVSGLLRSGTIRVHLPGASELVAEWQALPFDEDRKHHQEGYPDHCSDAARYAVLAACPAYKADRDPPEPGTAAHALMLASEHKARAFERAAKAARGGLRVR
jgi:hypothetical protein